MDADASVSEPSELLSEAEVAPSDLAQEVETAVEVPAEPRPEVASPTTGDETVTVWRFARPPAHAITEVRLVRRDGGFPLRESRAVSRRERLKRPLGPP